MAIPMSDRVRLPIGDVMRIAARDGYRCHWCEGPYRLADPWVLDHDIALARGGTNHEKNLRLAHKSCNESKGAS